MPMRNKTLWLVTILFLLVFNYQIFEKEKVIANGQEVFLALAPVDPRSLMQGDFMQLRYQVATQLQAQFFSENSQDGFATIQLDERNIGTLVEDVASAHNQNGTRLKMFYRRRGTQVKIATDAYFFQEGHGEDFSSAKYGVLRLGNDGHPVLIGLADNNLKLMRIKSLQ